MHRITLVCCSSSSSSIKALARSSARVTQESSALLGGDEPHPRRPRPTSLFASFALEKLSKLLPSASSSCEKLQGHDSSTSLQHHNLDESNSPVLSLCEKILQLEARESAYFTKCVGEEEKDIHTPQLTDSFSKKDEYLSLKNQDKQQQKPPPLPSAACSSSSSSVYRRALMRHYSPFINTSFVQRVAKRVNMEETLQYAKELLQRIEEDKYQNLALLLSREKQQYVSDISPCALLSIGGAPSHVEEASGILTRLKMASSSSSSSSALPSSSRRQQQQRQRVHVTPPEIRNIQVNEIISNGKVVTLTEPTLPHHILPGTSLRQVLDKVLHKQWVKHVLPTFALPPSSEIGLDPFGGHNNVLQGAEEGKTAVRGHRGRQGSPHGSGHLLHTLYLHLVVFRQGMSWGEVSSLLNEATRSALETGNNVSSNGKDTLRIEMGSLTFNMSMDNDVTSTQLCSLSILVKRISREGGRRTEKERDASSSPLQEEEKQHHATQGEVLPTHFDALYHALSGMNLRSPYFSLQILGWRVFGCSLPRMMEGRKQYSILLRHVHPAHNQKLLEASVQTKSMVFPNFFEPHVFGPLDCPFRSYHVLSAIEAGKIREAILMTVCLTLGREGGRRGFAVPPQSRRPTGGKGGDDIRSPRWIARLISLLRSKEERPRYLIDAFEKSIPSSLLLCLKRSKAYLMWNLMASCRLHALPHPRSVPLVQASCVSGDMIRKSTSVMEGVEGILKIDECCPSTHQSVSIPPQGLWMSTWGREEEEDAHAGVVPPRDDWRDEKGPFPSRGPSSATSSSSSSSGETIYLLTWEEAAVAYSLMDVTLPLPYGSRWADTDGFRELSNRLGFPSSTPYPFTSLDKGEGEVYYRALLQTCTGFPYASRPWVRVLEEPSIPPSEEDEGGERQREASNLHGSKAPLMDYRLFTDLECAESSTGRNFTSISRGQQAVIRPLDRLGHRMVNRLPPGLLAASASSSSARHSLSPSSIPKSLVMHGTIAGEASISNLLREVLIIDG